jgi:hypothetical protein
VHGTGEGPGRDSYLRCSHGYANVRSDANPDAEARRSDIRTGRDGHALTTHIHTDQRSDEHAHENVHADDDAYTDSDHLPGMLAGWVNGKRGPGCFLGLQHAGPSLV